jgi:methylated-DNA-protein-cysteine methyltransferase-like protein
MPREQRRVVGPGFHRRVYALVAKVPRGRVTTYGDIAAALGAPRAARQVGYALAALREDGIPWQRVINHRGIVSERGDPSRAALQQRMLEAEGIRFDRRGRVDLHALRWVYRRRRSS